MKILGIETSCDETGVAIYDSEHGLLADVLHSQLDVHAKYGGVVPELASRDHVQRLLPLLQNVLVQADIKLSDIDGIAYTAGPGLIGALLVGATFARSLAWANNLPAIGIHHMEAHLLAPMLEEQAPAFPFIALLVSGGHTQLVRVGGVGDYELLGETLDDAAGEAFDKVAKLLGLGYPGGPQIAALAEQGQAWPEPFPRPMTNRPGLDFSFSGLKTFVLNTWQASPKDEQARKDIAYSFQAAVADTLFIKCRRALEQTGLNRLVVAGGVSANKHLRARLQELSAEVFFPRPAFCTDNGAMVAYAGCLRLQQEQGSAELAVKARWPLAEVCS